MVAIVTVVAATIAVREPACVHVAPVATRVVSTLLVQATGPAPATLEVPVEAPAPAPATLEVPVDGGSSTSSSNPGGSSGGSSNNVNPGRGVPVEAAAPAPATLEVPVEATANGGSLVCLG